MSIDGVLLARHGETDDNAAKRFQGLASAYSGLGTEV